MASTTIPYIYQLQGLNYNKLVTTDFKIATIDPDHSGITPAQIASLEASGKSLFAYVAVGQIEPSRDYFDAGADYILGNDPEWGSHFVKFWDPQWQEIIINRATDMVNQGYSGMVMDVVNAFDFDIVTDASGGKDNARNDMMQFVKDISDATKAINPNFKIIQNNAVELLVVDPDDVESAPNTEYMAYIDGIDAESEFYMPDGSRTVWGKWDLQYLTNAVEAGKVVFNIEYVTGATQQAFITESIAHGFIPLISNRELSTISPVNTQIMSKLTPAGLALLEIDGAPTPSSPPAQVTSSGVTSSTAINGDHKMVGTENADMIVGVDTRDVIYGGFGSDTIYAKGGINYVEGNNGNDTLIGGGNIDGLNGGNGNDTITGGFGADFLKGGLGSDIFNFDNLTDSKNGSYDTINDFTSGQDKIDLHLLNIFGIDAFTDLTIINDVANNETVITAKDTARPGATENFELHLTGIVDLHQTDFMW